MICVLLRASRLTNEEPDEVGVVLGKEVIQIHKAGESAFVVFGSVPLHGYRQFICGLRPTITVSAWQQCRDENSGEQAAHFPTHCDLHPPCTVLCDQRSSGEMIIIRNW